MNLPSFSFLLNIRTSTGRGHLSDSKVRIRKQGRKEEKDGERAWVDTPQELRVKNRQEWKRCGLTW